MARLTRLLSVVLAASIGLAVSAIDAGIFADSAQAADVFRVAYAGSMGAVMDQVIGPAFAKANGVEYQGIGQGAYGLARQLEGKLLQADVFVPITPGPVEIVKKAGLIGTAVPVASAEMVIAYSPKSKRPGCVLVAPILRPIRKGKTLFSLCCWRRAFTNSRD
jgi:ABC-type molybdate transport system substrate-binding protein